MGDVDLFHLVESVDEAVEAIELVHVPVPQPLLHLSQLSAYGPFLVSVHALNLDVALIPQVVDNGIDCIVVNTFHHTTISFGGHLGKTLSDVVVVEAIFYKGISNVDLFYSLSPGLFKGNLSHPSCLA